MGEEISRNFSSYPFRVLGRGEKFFKLGFALHKPLFYQRGFAESRESLQVRARHLGMKLQQANAVTDRDSLHAA